MGDRDPILSQQMDSLAWPRCYLHKAKTSFLQDSQPGVGATLVASQTGVQANSQPQPDSFTQTGTL